MAREKLVVGGNNHITSEAVQKRTAGWGDRHFALAVNVLTGLAKKANAEGNTARFVGLNSLNQVTAWAKGEQERSRAKTKQAA